MWQINAGSLLLFQSRKTIKYLKETNYPGRCISNNIGPENNILNNDAFNIYDYAYKIHKKEYYIWDFTHTMSLHFTLRRKLVNK